MNTTLQVTRLSGQETINFDTLPVAKVTYYPMEEGSYKPYTQFCFGINDAVYALRGMAFEAITTPKSQMVIVLYPFADQPDNGVLITATPPGGEGVTAWVMQGERRLPLTVEARQHNGEDLQGIYWGWDIHLPLDTLRQYGQVQQAAGDTLAGNFYKIQTTEPQHYGSYAPATMTPEDIFAKESMADFQIVAY